MLNLSLTKYYAWFLLFCFIFTCISSVLRTFFISPISFVLLILPYLVAMVSVLYLFLKQQKRAPTRREMFKFAGMLNLLFWLFNFVGFVLVVLWMAIQDPRIWQYLVTVEPNPQLIALISLFIAIIAVPFYVITLWFYGPQAKRMAQHMFG
ncbi:hypothetical protein GCM10027155_00400 [Acinetobacter apis]|uniref:Uncharacterized protein n=1 Tax=Acinetobacter apis TaxID=1229165 RepID=A0A217EC98_9GAMM|nr:ABZJ_00895 family protein [Acinetobacter apis]SNQ28128.1 hypothetical protein SAMN05444584_0036 [Acinetobacter apis]